MMCQNRGSVVVSFASLLTATILVVDSPRVALAEETRPAGTASTGTVDFNEQIRPILTKHCSSCHGGVKQAGDVSFVYADQVLPPDGWVVEPGDAESSVLIERVRSDDPDLRMPPPDEHPEPLPEEDIALLERWINEGAAWGDHWSIAPLLDPTSRLDPEASDSQFGQLRVRDWIKQPLDRVMASKFLRDDLVPADESSPEEWLRRVSFDLTGLPPSDEQRQGFLNDLSAVSGRADREKVYRRFVDRLLASPEFGERWASVWMDLARYADSKGFEKDPHRDMWPYRDWLVRAFNSDMPYDDFTLKQLAGDLVDDPTADDLIATAFHRNTQTNTEGGTDDEEFRIAAVIDRVNTTWTVWQATTMGCVQCHSHPYDPLQHEEFYASLALLNDSLDVDLDSDFPTLRVPADSAEVSAALELQQRYEASRVDRNQLGSQLAREVEWSSLTPRSIGSSGGQLKIDGDSVRRSGGTFPVGVTYTFESDSVPMRALRIEILPESSDPTNLPERGSVLSSARVTQLAADGTEQEVPLADVFVDALSGPDDPRGSLKAKSNSKAIGGYPKLHRPRWAVFVLKKPLVPSAGGKIRIEMNQRANVTGNLATPLRHFRWLASDDDRWQELLASKELAGRTTALDDLKRKVSDLRGASLPVMRPLPKDVARSTRLFIRGNWTDRGDPVSAGIPEVFRHTSAGDAASGSGGSPIRNRFELASWLVSKDNPLAARVWANRIWAQLFGVGIVETLEDFGSSGALPSQPELLEHLAVAIRDRYDWRLKPLLREIVLSAIYRQTNRVDRADYERDPANRALARGPRTRLTAEMVRDQALSASGLLTSRQGGPSVMPPQPDGVWQTVYSGAQWKTAKGADRYRRALYTYWRRTSPYPSMMMFDSPTRDLCSARRISTNTPLQALVTLNDPVYVECSRGLAKIARIKFPDDDRQQIAWMFETVTQRSPGTDQLSALQLLYDNLLQTPASSGGEPKQADVIRDQDNAKALVANTILNLDWALTK